MVDAPSSDDLPLLPADAAPVQPPIPVQQHQHAADNPPPSDDGLPMAPVAKPPILSSSWLQAGKQLWDEGTRGALLGTRAAAEGLGGVVGAVGDVLTYPGRAGMRAIGYQPPDQFPWMKDLTTAPSQQIQSTIDQTGLPTPQTTTEANTSTVVRAVAPVVLGGLSPTATVPSVVRSGVSAGVGGLAGEKIAQSDLVPPYLKPSVNLLVSMLAAKGADIPASLTAKGVNALRGNVSPEYAAFQRLGLPTSLVGTVGGGEAGQSAEAAMSRVPFASSIIRPVQQRTVDAFGNAVDRAALQLDPAMTATNAQTTGESLQNSYRNWVANTFPARNQAAWAPLDQRMAGAAVDQTPYRAALDNAANPPNLASMPATQRAFSLPQARTWLDALNADFPPGASLTWEQARALRTRIGDAMGTPDLVSSIGMQNLRNIYGGLARGLEATAVQHGQGQLFNNANAVTTTGHTFMENVGSKIATANNPLQESITPEQATRNLLNSGDTTLQAVRTEIPAAADQLAAYNLRQASAAKPSQATAYDDTSTGTFLTNINRMRQNKPGGYAALYPPQVQQALDDLQTAAGRLRTTERHLNTSGTAEQLGWMEYLRNIAEKAGTGEIGKTAGAVVIPPTVGWGGGRLMTSPALTRYTAAQPAGPPIMPPTTAGLLGATPQLTGQ